MVALSPRPTETIKRQFREAAKELDGEPPDPKPKSRRRSGEDTSGGFRLYARSLAQLSGERAHGTSLPRIAPPVLDQVRSQSPHNKDKTDATVSDEPLSAGALINWYLANGFSMREIREMFPTLFSDPVPTMAPTWDAVDWLRQWESCGAAAVYANDFQYLDISPAP